MGVNQESPDKRQQRFRTTVSDRFFRIEAATTITG
jgi:hypothetical protein